jgi:putative hemolysin
MSPSTTLFVVFLCVLLEGFFSGSEIALVSTDRLKLASRAKHGHLASQHVLDLLARPDHLLGTCLIGTNLCVVTASTLVTHMIIGVVPSAFLASAIFVPFVLVFAEMVPKTVYAHFADRIAPIVATPVRWASIVFRPALWVIGGVDWLLLKLTRAPADLTRRSVSRDEIRQMVDTSGEEAINEDERDFIRRVFEFGDATVEDAMVPLVEVVAAPDTMSVAAAGALMMETGFSRLPVYKGRVDAVIGMVSHRDLLFAASLESTVASCLRTVPFVPESKRLEDLFTELRRDRQHLSVVVDEYGGTVGIITTEDIMEEIVGDIHDESDPEPPKIQRLGERSWLVSGRLEREPLQEQLGLVLPEGDFETLAGFLLNRLGRIPLLNERLSWNDWKFTVVKATDRAILEVNVTRLGPGRKTP